MKTRKEIVEKLFPPQPPIPICPYHLKIMVPHRENVPKFVRVWKDDPPTRTVFRCPVAKCPRIEEADHDYKPTYELRGFKNLDGT